MTAQVIGTGYVGPGSRAELQIGYGAPWEPGVPGWRSHLWRNRPCCFLHLELMRRPPLRDAIPRGRTTVLGGRRGILRPTYGPQATCGSGATSFYWCNHVVFAWSELGGFYVATLHSFGNGPTTRLLGEIVRGLRPVDDAAPASQARDGIRNIPVGVAPVGLAPSAAALWVATFGDRTPAYRGSIFQLDSAGRFTRRTLLRGHPLALARGAGAVWAVARDQVIRVDSNSGSVVARIRVGRWPRDVAVFGKRVWALVAQPPSTHGARLVEVDPATNRPTGRFVALGAQPVTVASAAGSLWVADSLSGSVERIDPVSAHALRTIRVGHRPFGLASGYGSVWVTNVDDGTISRIDVERDRTVATIRVGRNPYGIVTGGGGIWVANAGSGTVTRIDPATNSVAQTIPLGGDPFAVAVVGRRLWVTRTSASDVSRIEPRVLGRR
jgi:YVTN family beta-propeller protein